LIKASSYNKKARGKFVDKYYQNKGIGKELIRMLQEQIGEEVALLLLSSPIAISYYPHIGFQKFENGFCIPRKR
jgi:predicted N-acetyltransferase YhbS